MLHSVHHNILIKICFLISIVCLSAGSAEADSAKDLYQEADTTYKKLLDDPRENQYRGNWFGAIRQFQSVYRMNPKGDWAPAGLYMAGQLYSDLYERFHKEADKIAAEELLRRTVQQFPGSEYGKKADRLLGKMGFNPVLAKKAVKPPVKTDTKPDELFYKAQSCYRSLQNNPAQQKYRSRWLTCISKFKSVYEAEPVGPWAAAGLYMSGMLYEGLYGNSFSPKDKQQALSAFQSVVREFPDSRYRKNAEIKISEMTGKRKPVSVEMEKPSDPVPGTTGLDDIRKVIADADDSIGSPDPEPIVVDNGPADGKTYINGIRYWSNPNYTRIVIDAGGSIKYDTPHLLGENRSLNKLRRLYFDVHQGRLGKNLKTFIPIDDNLLSAVRAAQYAPEVVRVVIDIKSYKTYKIFHLMEPSRIVVDVWGDAGPAPPASKTRPVEPICETNEKISPGALARQLALGVRRVVIDPGHGGKDPGAPGYVKGVQEKDVTLKMARLLAKRLEKELKCEVLLTRNSDKTLSLEERTALANTKNADLFISIHANAHKNKDVYGIETYYLNLATDDESIRVAARENATSEKNISDLHSILSDLMQNAKINESSRLAAYVQSAMVDNMKSRHSRIRNNGVKKAPFYVLLGAQMPAVLVETAFISNQRECNRLTDSKYQQDICNAIVEGVRNYIKETCPSALTRK